jgi:hypothetical protein
MNFVLPEISYDSRDYAGIRDDMISLIKFYTEEWTDHNPTDFGIVLLETFAAMADVLHYYADRVDQNTKLPTAFTRQAVINILKPFGYRLSWKSAASVDVTFTLNARVQESWAVPTNFAVTSDSGKRFETASELAMPDVLLTADSDGTTAITVDGAADFQLGATCGIGDDDSAEIERIIEAIDGDEITFTESIPAGIAVADNAYCYQKVAVVSSIEGQSKSETLGTSDGKVYQSYTLEATDILDDSLHIFVGANEYPLRNSLARSLPTDNHCYFDRDQDGLVTVFFGDNRKGKIPPKNSVITAIFRTGGGADGNVGAGTIKTCSDTVTVGGNTVSLSVANVAQSSGGGPEESIEDAKLNGPNSISTLDRAVSLDDYQNLILANIDGVAKASAKRIGLGGINVIIAPNGGGVASSSLIASVQDLVDEKGAADFCVVSSAKNVKIDHGMNIGLFSNASRNATLAAIRSAIDGFYDFDGRTFGGRNIQTSNIRLSDLIGLLEQTAGVDTVDIYQLALSPQNTVEYEVYSGDYTIGDLIANAGSKAEIITVTFLSSTAFSVRGSITGIHPDGVIDSEYASKNAEFKFMISSASRAPRKDDRIVFHTSEYFSRSIILDSSWIAVKGVLGISLTGGI